MANTAHFTGGKGAIWIQPDGLSTPVVFLGCHEVASISEPLGDYTPFFCPDPSGVSKWVASGETLAPPAAVTTQILEDITDALTILERQKCPFLLYVNLNSCGRKDVFTNYAKTFIVDTRKITSRTFSNLALREGDDRSEATYDLSGAPPLVILVDVSSTAQVLPAATGTGE